MIELVCCLLFALHHVLLLLLQELHLTTRLCQLLLQRLSLRGHCRS